MKESSSRMDGCWREQPWFARLEPRSLRLLSASMWPRSEDAYALCRICELKDRRTLGPLEIERSSSTLSITNRHPQRRNSPNARAVKRRSTLMYGDPVYVALEDSTLVASATMLDHGISWLAVVQ